MHKKNIDIYEKIIYALYFHKTIMYSSTRDVNINNFEKVISKKK